MTDDPASCMQGSFLSEGICLSKDPGRHNELKGWVIQRGHQGSHRLALHATHSGLSTLGSPALLAGVFECLKGGFPKWVTVFSTLAPHLNANDFWQSRCLEV